MKLTSIRVAAVVIVAMHVTGFGIRSTMAESGAHKIFIDAVAEHHGITEPQAMERLALEAEAAAALQVIKALPLKGYAGAWFDGETLQLKVATSSAADKGLIERFNAVPVMVRHSMDDLERKLATVRGADRASATARSPVKGFFIDYRKNRAVVRVSASDHGHVRNVIAANRLTDVVDIEVVAHPARLSSGNVRAADGTRNGTWTDNPNYGNFWPCSIGASVEGGYVTAGHCGDVGNEMRTPGGTTLGTVMGSTWFTPARQDSGWVDTTWAWTPSALVNGYSDGQFSFTGEWGGIVSSPVGSTVCRYGQTSGGPDCGVIDAKNVTDTFAGGKTIDNMTRATGICTDDGDSGGPYIAGDRQMQGTNIGGSPGRSCPNPEDFVLFQPIGDTLDEFSRIMLTEHGPNAPTINTANCAPLDQTNYVCFVSDVDSQGDPDISWTSSTYDNSTDRVLQGTCFPGENVNVDLDVSNSYGVTSRSFWLQCLTSGPLQ